MITDMFRAKTHSFIKTMIFLLVFILVSVLTKTREGSAVEEISMRDEMVKAAGYGEDKLSTVVINGRLICHADPTHKAPIHVAGAKVGVFCGKNKVSFAKGSTNRYGEFVIDLPSHLHAIPDLEKVCMFKVFHLPRSSPCRRAFPVEHKTIVKCASTGQGARAYTTNDIHLMQNPTLGRL